MPINIDTSSRKVKVCDLNFGPGLTFRGLIFEGSLHLGDMYFSK